MTVKGALQEAKHTVGLGYCSAFTKSVESPVGFTVDSLKFVKLVGLRGHHGFLFVRPAFSDISLPLLCPRLLLCTAETLVGTCWLPLPDGLQRAKHGVEVWQGYHSNCTLAGRGSVDTSDCSNLAGANVPHQVFERVRSSVTPPSSTFVIVDIIVKPRRSPFRTGKVSTTGRW